MRIPSDPWEIYSIPRGSSEVQVEAFEGSLDGMPVYFLNGDPIRASGSVYSSNNKLDGEKYAFFSLAALELPRHINWTPDIIHANDWHTALASYGNLVKRWDEKTRRVSSIVTIHNLPFMGPDVSDEHRSLWIASCEHGSTGLGAGDADAAGTYGLPMRSMRFHRPMPMKFCTKNLDAACRTSSGIEQIH